MKQRVSLARAMIHDPKLLIMDEPANGLDPRARIEFRTYAKKLAAQGKAILISSHILADLNEICTGCLIVEKGRLVKKITGDLRGIDLESVFIESTRGDVQ
jgi:ABC-2 type transport system ATP-binding protein